MNIIENKKSKWIITIDTNLQFEISKNLEKNFKDLSSKI
jgi:hypothetical protein